MARWEYCRISWAEHVRAPDAQAGAAGNTSGGGSMVPNMGQQDGPTGWVEYLGRGAAAERITQLDATIARLGLAGWELVSHVQWHDRVSVQHWYFKRELTDMTRNEF